MFKDKVVVITGAGSGIGRELALQFADEGARLALSDINRAGLDQTLAMIAAKPGVVGLWLVWVRALCSLPSAAAQVPLFGPDTLKLAMLLPVKSSWNTTTAWACAATTAASRPPNTLIDDIVVLWFAMRRNAVRQG